MHAQCIFPPHPIPPLTCHWLQYAKIFPNPTSLLTHWSTTDLVAINQLAHQRHQTQLQFQNQNQIQTQTQPQPQPQPQIFNQVQSGNQSRAPQQYFCLWSTCHTPFARPSDLDRHVRSLHLDIRRHCTVPGCADNAGRGFKRADKSRAHLRGVHGL